MTNIVQLPNNSADWSAIVAELCEIIDVKPMRYMAIEAAEWPVQREMLYDAAGEYVHGAKAVLGLFTGHCEQMHCRRLHKQQPIPAAAAPARTALPGE